MDRDNDVSLPIPGRRTRAIARVWKASFLILLVSLVPVISLPGWAAFASESGNGETDSSVENTGLQPRTVGADPVPDLSLPRTVLSSVDRLVGAGGVVYESADNLTLYNLGIRMRLLGGVLPHDELVGLDNRILSSRISWRVETQEGTAWVPLLPSSSSFTIMGTNASGTFVARDMQLGLRPHAGHLRMLYKATSQGPLKWDLIFTPESSGRYRLAYDWWNVTDRSNNLGNAKQMHVEYGNSRYTFSWDDVPKSLMTTTITSSGFFSLFIDLGQVNSGSTVTVDPSIVASNVAAGSTAYNFQRKVFYEEEGGYYWVFYFDGNSMRYRNSRDGITWSAAQSLPSGLFPWGYQGAEYGLVHVYNSGQTVVVAAGETKTETFPQPWTGSVSIRTSLGTISGANLTWAQVGTAETVSRTCDNRNTGPNCTLTHGIRYVSVTVSSNNSLAYSYNWFANGPGPGKCGPDNFTESLVMVRYATMSGTVVSCGDITDTHRNRSIILPSNPQGHVRVIYQIHDPSFILKSWTSNGLPIDFISYDMADGDEFSAVSDTDYGTHLAFKVANGNINYAYRSLAGPWFVTTSNIFSGVAGYPTLTIDYATNDVYAFAIQGSSVGMRTKSVVQAWADRSIVFPVTGRTSPTNLGSNLASVSTTNSSRVLLVWTEGTGPYSTTFASIPIQTVWSPFASPSDPWDGNGISPYGRYFANIGEYVSTSSGILTIRQSDLSVPGRGLNLEITRVYTGPFSFLGGQPYNYERYPWAPLGNGWQLDFPWMYNVSAPSYLHLWGGQGYRIPSSFWQTSTATLENHQGEHFRLEKDLSGTVTLYTRSGISYWFDTARRLTTIIDTTSNNTISFSYLSNRISSVTDTVGRTFLFCYNSSNLLSSIDQASGSCSSETGFVRRVAYGYTGPNLVTVTDPGGRVTSYRYDGVSDVSVSPWLVSRVTYPTQWYSNYTYGTSLLGTQAVTYNVIRQLVATSTAAPVRQFEYGLTRSGDIVTDSVVRTYNGTLLQLTGYTDYSFSFAGVTQNVSDASHRLVRGNQQRFGVNGEIAREIVLVTDGSGNVASYTNLYRYDLWGNLIYSDKRISNAVVEGYDFSNAGSGGSMYVKHPAPIPPWEGFQTEWGQCFTVPTGPERPITTAKFFLGRAGAYVPTVNMYAALYATTGTPNLDCVPANAPGIELAVSQPINASILTYDKQIVTFHFNKTNQFVLRSGQNYGIAIHAHGPGLLYVDAMITIGTDASTPTHPGNLFYYDGFTDGSDYDACSIQGCSAPTDLVFEVESVVSHETFNAYYNNGLPPGFYSFQETFSLNDGSTAENSWATQQGSWAVKNGAYNGTKTGGQQESVLAWNDLGKSDVSLQARVQVTRPVDADNQKVGVFVHYPGTGTSKWALVLHTTAASGTRLELIDEGQISTLVKQIVCPSINPISTGIWYTFNLTVRGYDAQGWVKAPGQSQCLIDGKYTNSNLAASTGFGLYAGGYSAVFDDVIVTTVSPFITSTGFSNSFFQYGSPGGPGLNQWLHTRKEPEGNWNLAWPWLPASGWNPAPLVADYGQSPWGTLLNWPDSNAKWTWWNPDAETSSGDDRVWFRRAFNFPVSGGLSISITADDSYSLYINGFLVGSDNDWRTFETYSIGGSAGIHVLAIAADNAGSGNPAGLLLTARDFFTGQVLFRTDGLSGPNTSSLAGTAELQDGANSPAMENYNSYVLWGGLGETKRRFDSPTGVQWLPETVSYDGRFGNVRTRTDAKGNVTYFDYSSSFQSAYVTNHTQVLTGQTPVRVTTLYSYNFSIGNVLTVTDPKGNVTTYQNDGLGRTTKITHPQGLGTVQYAYNDLANYADITDANGKKIREWYDGLGRLSRTERFSGITSYSNETYTYDWANKPLSHKDAVARVYRYSYDILGRTIQVTRPDGLSVSRQYNDIASWMRALDEDGNYSCSIYDRVGKLLSIIERASSDCQTGIVTNYFYDEIGNLVRKTNPDLQFMAHTYDNLNRLTRTTYFDGTTEEYVYDSNGNIARKTDRRGVQTLQSYDSLDRVKTTTYCGSRIYSDNYTYDKNGNPTRVESKNATLTFSYDARDRLLRETDSINAATTFVDLGCGSGTIGTNAGNTATNTINFAYAGDALSTITYPNGLIVTYGYDGLGRDLTVSKQGGTTYATFSYFADDSLKGVSFGNGLLANYTYDSMGRPAQTTLKKGGTTLLSLTFSYNSTGTIASIVGQLNGVSVNEQYRYDPLRRLTNTTVTSGGTTTSIWYEYDSSGNRLRQNLNGVLTSYTYNAISGQLTGTSQTGKSVAYSYDPAGNPLSRNVTTSGTDRWTYTWDTAARLTKVTKNGAVQGLYAYDSNGRQIESVEGSTTTFYAYLGTETLYEKAGTKSTDYVYSNGMRISKIAGTKTSYYHADHLGSTRLVTDSTGKVAFSDNYQPFGLDNGAQTGSETYKFTGKPWKPAVGLYYYFQRWYDPEIGRFISQDPLLGELPRPQTHNRYAYVVNNPLEYNDPSGEFFNIVIGTIAGAIIGGVSCAIQNGGWSNSCLTSIAVGALVGAVAGATFGVALGAFAGTSLAGSLVATVIAGAVSGGLSGAVSYTAETVLTGQQFSLTGLATSVGFGIATGAAFAGVGYGIGKYAPKIFGFGGQRAQVGDDIAGLWNRGTFGSVKQSLKYHMDQHALGRNSVQYTNDALAARDALWNAPGVRQGLVPAGGVKGYGTLVQRMTGSVGWQIWQKAGSGGVFTITGKVITFWG